MKKKSNKICIVCGKEYTFCNGCNEFDHLPRWMSIYHDENCKEIFGIASDYLANELSKEDAKDKLKKCDLTNKKAFHKSIIKALDEINEVTKVETIKEEKVENVSTEETKTRKTILKK